jgi:adenosylcobinamide kinase/adenosylcobinamide-phosphate guanylyltransferase
MLLAETLDRQNSPVVLVTNEVGLGIVPDNALARRFRDAAGILNQIVARVADEVEFVVAGLPMRVK